MNKLTNHVAAFAPLSARRSVTAAPTFRALFPSAVPTVTPVSRRGLTCGWTIDASGRLVCGWSETSLTEDQSSTRRGFGCAGLALAA